MFVMKTYVIPAEAGMTALAQVSSWSTRIKK